MVFSASRYVRLSKVKRFLTDGHVHCFALPSVLPACPGELCTEQGVGHTGNEGLKLTH